MLRCKLVIVTAQFMNRESMFRLCKVIFTVVKIFNTTFSTLVFFHSHSEIALKKKKAHLSSQQRNLLYVNTVYLCVLPAFSPTILCLAFLLHSLHVLFDPYSFLSVNSYNKSWTKTKSFRMEKKSHQKILYILFTMLCTHTASWSPCLFNITQCVYVHVCTFCEPTCSLSQWT